MDVVEAENSMLALGATKLIAYSDRKGRFVRSVGRDNTEALLAEGLDVLSSAAAEFGRRRGVGQLRTAIFTYSDATVLVGAVAHDKLVYVLADPDPVHLGLLIAHLRTLVNSAKGALS